MLVFFFYTGYPPGVPVFGLYFFFLQRETAQHAASIEAAKKRALFSEVTAAVVHVDHI